MEIIQTLLLVTVVALLVKKPTKTKESGRGPQIVLDTCALIDGRILSVVDSGFINQRLIVPKFVIDELQYLADGNDSQKRERARFGLDVIKRLQDHPNCSVQIYEKDIPEIKETDAKLVELARKLDADLCTTDYNLNKVASVQSVRVLNVNELAGLLRPVALPGERKQVKIIQKGSSKDQGVGYLQDGTMIVVENGAKLMNKKVTVEITKTHQSDAGKMMFGRVISRAPAPNRSRT